MDKNQRSTAPAPLRRPMLSLPPRSAVESIFTGASTVSPGPMTLVSSFFSENDPDSDCRSFSQLLAGDASPESGGGCGSESDLRFKMNRPSGLVVTQPLIFTIPPGLSPASLLDSPGLYSASQALAQVTVQASQAHCQPQIQVEYRSSTATPASSFQQLTASISNTSTYQQMQFSSMPKTNLVNESAEFSYSDMRSHPSSCTVDKPADDGYNWRKYGQKQVKGSEYPRSYYKCTQLNCPVKKIVERSLEGQVTEIVYKGQHNHQPPQSSKRGKDTGNSIETTNFQGNSGGQIANSGKMNDGRSVYSLPAKDHELSLGTHDHLSGSSDSDEVDDSETRGNERSKDEPEAKRRITEVRVVESVSSHRTVTEPRIVVQTTSEVDLLDDGFRWRKYGQKVVKGNPYPRSYYKCTSAGCNVRKHVERAASDPKAVITTYEGKHKHDVPAAKNSSHITANSLPLHSKPNNVIGDKNALTTRTEFPNYDQQQPVGVLRFKEEQSII